MTSLLKFTFRHRNIVSYSECKRFAGHSKWANIRHTKMARDSARAGALQMLMNKMRVAIAEGKSAKPDENPKLAKLVDQAKRNSLPLTSIKSFLEKMQGSKNKTQAALFEARGPSGCVVLIQLLSDNIAHSRNQLNNHLRKTKFSTSELPNDNLYMQKGIILTEVDGRELDKALDDAIEVGAEEVEKCKEEDKEFLQFTCQPSDFLKVRDKLEALNYKVIQSDIEYTPQILVTLTDEEMETVNKLYERLNNFEEVVRVYSNIS